MYILNSQKTLFSKLNNVYIEKSDEYYRVDEYGNKKYIYYLYNDNYRVGFFNSLEKAKKMLYDIKLAYETPLTYNDYTVIEIKDDYHDIYKEF